MYSSNIVRYDAAIAGNLIVVPQTNGDQQDLCRHGRSFVHMCDGVVASVAIRFQIARGRNEHAVGVESMGHREFRVAEPAGLPQALTCPNTIFYWQPVFTSNKRVSTSKCGRSLCLLCCTSAESIYFRGKAERN